MCQFGAMLVHATLLHCFCIVRQALERVLWRFSLWWKKLFELTAFHLPGTHANQPQHRRASVGKVVLFNLLRTADPARDRIGFMHATDFMRTDLRSRIASCVLAVKLRRTETNWRDLQLWLHCKVHTTKVNVDLRGSLSQSLADVVHGSSSYAYNTYTYARCLFVFTNKQKFPVSQALSAHQSSNAAMTYSSQNTEKGILLNWTHWSTGSSTPQKNWLSRTWAAMWKHESLWMSLHTECETPCAHSHIVTRYLSSFDWGGLWRVRGLRLSEGGRRHNRRTRPCQRLRQSATKIPSTSQSGSS